MQSLQSRDYLGVIGLRDWPGVLSHGTGLLKYRRLADLVIFCYVKRR